TGRFHEHSGARCPGFPDHLGFPQAAPEGAWRSVQADFAAVREGGLVKLGHVALDGTKIKANASKHKAMSYERMEKRAAELEAEVAKWLSSAEAADVQEDEIFGKDKRGDEMPDWASDKAKRLAKIQEAMAALEADAKLAAEEERRIEAEKQQQRNAEG